jgi:hypothetical protein
LLYAAVFGKNVTVGFSDKYHSLMDGNGAIDAKVIGLISCIIPNDFRTRIKWESHIAILFKEGAFYDTFTIDLASFQLLTLHTPSIYTCSGRNHVKEWNMWC